MGLFGESLPMESIKETKMTHAPAAQKKQSEKTGGSYGTYNYETLV